MLRLLILLSSDASLYSDAIDMMYRYSRSLYHPISIPKCKQTSGLRKENSSYPLCHSTHPLCPFDMMYQYSRSLRKNQFVPVPALQPVSLTIVHDDR